MAEGIHEIGDEVFKSEVLDAPVPVLVDFWAPWCMPCRAIAPTLEGMAKEYSGKVKFVKINVDDHQRVAGEFQIKSIPTLLIFKGGKLVDALLGGQTSKQKIQESFRKAGVAAGPLTPDA